MATILGRFTKQPSEVLDYFVDYTDWFANRSDTPLSFETVAEPGLTVAGTGISGNVVKVVLAGGVAGSKYKVTVLLTTTSSPAIIKEADFIVSVKEA